MPRPLRAPWVGSCGMQHHLLWALAGYRMRRGIRTGPVNVPWLAAPSRHSVDPIRSPETRGDRCADILAGVVGFEPTVHGTKNRCLTTWLHPSNGASHVMNAWNAFNSKFNPSFGQLPIV